MKARSFQTQRGEKFTHKPENNPVVNQMRQRYNRMLQ